MVEILHRVFSVQIDRILRIVRQAVIALKLVGEVEVQHTVLLQRHSRAGADRREEFFHHMVEHRIPVGGKGGHPILVQVLVGNVFDSLGFHQRGEQAHIAGDVLHRFHGDFRHVSLSTIVRQAAVHLHKRRFLRLVFQNGRSIGTAIAGIDGSVHTQPWHGRDVVIGATGVALRSVIGIAVAGP